MAPDDKDNTDTSPREKDYSAKIYKIKHMTKKEWRAYKEKQKNKIKSTDKVKANKAAKRLEKLKKVRKDKNDKKMTKLKNKAETVKTAAKHVISVVKQSRDEQKAMVKERMKPRNLFEGYTTEKYLRDSQK